MSGGWSNALEARPTSQNSDSTLLPEVGFTCFRQRIYASLLNHRGTKITEKSQSLCALYVSVVKFYPLCYFMNMSL
jgi:hypothetical protein